MRMPVKKLKELAANLLDMATKTPDGKQPLVGSHVDVEVQFENGFYNPNDKPPNVVYLYLPDGTIWRKQKNQKRWQRV